MADDAIDISGDALLLHSAMSTVNTQYIMSWESFAIPKQYICNTNNPHTHEGSWDYFFRDRSLLFQGALWFLSAL